MGDPTCPSPHLKVHRKWLSLTPQVHLALSTPLLLVSTKKRITVLHYSIGVPIGRSLKLLEELHNPELKDLASHLPETILHSQADSTVKKYLSAHRRWKKWAASHKFSVFPAKPHQFVLYLQYLGELTKSKSAVEEACNECLVMGPRELWLRQPFHSSFGENRARGTEMFIG